MSIKSKSTPSAPKAPPELAAAEIVMNAETGEVIHAKNADVQQDPASLTKQATAYMALRAVQNGSAKLDQMITISEGAAKLDNNTLNVPGVDAEGNKVSLETLPAGSRMTLREALVVMLTSSANGVAKAVGEALAPAKLNSKGKPVPGSERDFAREMTRVMQDELGMKSSSFINASGLNNGGAEQKTNLSTARDLAMLNHRLMKDFPEFEKLLGAHTATTNIILPDKTKIKTNSATTNHFVRDFADKSPRASKEGFHAVGPQKTGFNKLSGGINLLATAENNDGVRLTSVVLGGKDSDKRYAANLKNLREGFAKVEAEPQLATAYQRGAMPSTMVAMLSPASAFAEPKPAKAERPTRMFAKADGVDTPKRRFNRAGHRHEAAPANVPAIVPVSFKPEAVAPVLERIETISLEAQRASLATLPVIVADANVRPAARPETPVPQFNSPAKGLGD